MAKKDVPTAPDLLLQKLGKPMTVNRERDEKSMHEQMQRDRRDEAVEEILDDARDIYTAASEDFHYDDDGLRAVLRLAFDKWEV